MTLFWKDFSFTKHKHCEIQLDSKSLKTGFSFGADFTASWKCDHAGFNTTITLPGIFFCFTFYDSRHWDEETNNYKIYK